MIALAASVLVALFAGPHEGHDRVTSAVRGESDLRLPFDDELLL